jgi:hypothetical protein
VTELLGSVGLENTGDWDLVSLEGTERNQPTPDLFGNYNHYRHLLYVTEDVNTSYLANNFEFPGQTLPCRCKGCSCPVEDGGNGQYQSEPEARIGFIYHNAHCRYHHGGEVVFARRKLEDTTFAQNLDRFWIDWVSFVLPCPQF